MADLLRSISTTSLIFGGCCSNVFTLEAIVRNEPDSGLLITFIQWIFAASIAYPTQFSPGSPYTLRPTNVPIQKWAFIAALFFGINMLNNWAFAFDISVPVHIILRSFGSVTTMAAGYIRGKNYSSIQVLSVVILTVGVLVSAYADALSKGKDLSANSPTASSPSAFLSGLSVILLAQILSAYMGIYVQDTYAQHGADWRENLFYSHALSLPLFLPLAPTLQRQYARLAATPPLEASTISSAIEYLRSLHDFNTSPLEPVLRHLERFLTSVPRGQVLLLLNGLTQLGCITGVNLLSADASAVTVTIVLNVRKLVSFVFSTVLFGHDLSGLMMFGTALVFGSGALYGWESSWRLPSAKKEMDGSSGKKAQ